MDSPVAVDHAQAIADQYIVPATWQSGELFNQALRSRTCAVSQIGINSVAKLQATIQIVVFHTNLEIIQELVDRVLMIPVPITNDLTVVLAEMEAALIVSD